MCWRIALALAMAAIVASGDQEEHVKCSQHCSFNGRRIISCAGEVSNEDIVHCYTKNKQATVLDLALSDIQHISRDLFRGLIRIRHIYLDFVETERVDKDSFSEMKSLQSISLRGVGPDNLDMFLAAVMKRDTFLAVNIDGNYKNCSSRWLSIIDQLTADNILIEYSRFTPRCGNGKQGRLDFDRDHPVKPRPAPWLSHNNPEYARIQGDTVQDIPSDVDNDQVVPFMYSLTYDEAVQSDEQSDDDTQKAFKLTNITIIVVVNVLLFLGLSVCFPINKCMDWVRKRKSAPVNTCADNASEYTDTMTSFLPVDKLQTTKSKSAQPSPD